MENVTLPIMLKYTLHRILRYIDTHSFIVYINRILCYIDTYSFIVYIKVEDICSDISKDAETRFDTSTYELTDLYLKEKIKIVVWLKKINERWILWGNNNGACCIETNDL